MDADQLNAPWLEVKSCDAVILPDEHGDPKWVGVECDTTDDTRFRCRLTALQAGLLVEGIERAAQEIRFSEDEHRQHCATAACSHPAVYPDGSQGWCARCRAVAFGAVYEGLAFRDGRIVEVD
jgi:hypothetical protein